MSAGLSRVRVRFLEMLSGRLQRLDELHAAIRAGENLMASLTEAGEIAHKLAGTAGTLGFKSLGDIAIEVDVLSQESAKAGRAPDTLFEAKLTSLRDECRAAIADSDLPVLDQNRCL